MYNEKRVNEYVTTSYWCCIAFEVMLLFSSLKLNSKTFIMLMHSYTKCSYVREA